MNKILYKAEDFPRWLPDEVKNEAIARLDYLKNLDENKKLLSIKENLRNSGISTTDPSKGINFFYKLLVDERMKNVWNKLFKINKEQTVKLLRSLETNYTIFYNPEITQFTNLYDKKQKMEILKSTIDKCANLLEYTGYFHTVYTTEFDFEEYNRSELMGESDHNEFINNLKHYKNRLEEILSFHKENQEKFKTISYLENPISRKSKVDNAEAILWAKKLKFIFLSRYKRPLNKEIGIIISILFDDENHCYDEDYIAKTTRDIKVSIKKMEDSN